eukprot:1097429-Pyramimonas_sp.AAC.1
MAPYHVAVRCGRACSEAAQQGRRNHGHVSTHSRHASTANVYCICDSVYQALRHEIFFEAVPSILLQELDTD